MHCVIQSYYNIYVIETKESKMKNENQKFDKSDAIYHLSLIKKSIIENASDVLFLYKSNSTVCEHIDSILSDLGISDDDLQRAYDQQHVVGIDQDNNNDKPKSIDEFSANAKTDYSSRRRAFLTNICNEFREYVIEMDNEGHSENYDDHLEYLTDAFETFIQNKSEQ